MQNILNHYQDLEVDIMDDERKEIEDVMVKVVDQKVVKVVELVAKESSKKRLHVIQKQKEFHTVCFMFFFYIHIFKKLFFSKKLCQQL